MKSFAETLMALIAGFEFSWVAFFQVVLFYGSMGLCCGLAIILGFFHEKRKKYKEIKYLLPVAYGCLFISVLFLFSFFLPVSWIN